jgi:signal transduction histidine kinase
VTLDARDDGSGVTPGAANRGDGSGLSGMRERVDALGGRLEVVPDAAPGFAVRAFLPTSAETAVAGTGATP